LAALADIDLDSHGLATGLADPEYRLVGVLQIDVCHRNACAALGKLFRCSPANTRSGPGNKNGLTCKIHSCILFVVLSRRTR
jgi:hypothetical protein